MPRSSKRSLSFRYSHRNPVHTSPLPIRATCPSYLILLDSITRKIMSERYRSLSSSLCSFLHSSVTSSLLGPNILLNASWFKSKQYQMVSCYWITTWKRCGRKPDEASSLHLSVGSEQNHKQPDE
jgi:hypothetical protein